MLFKFQLKKNFFLNSSKILMLFKFQLKKNFFLNSSKISNILNSIKIFFFKFVQNFNVLLKKIFPKTAKILMLYKKKIMSFLLYFLLLFFLLLLQIS
ncbi:MAG: hypothetical protein B6I24_04440 [Bacteroidetes bacterium 4572_128]|nr:MAG: hypothetical protein B6I24_04440 [Bacteroidetes bacterium 4572_128]